MNNCLVLGFGRSGTSMMGGLLEAAGYYIGENSYEPRNSNPKGFFEDARINRLNELILQTFDSKQIESFSITKTYSPFTPRYGHRWLSFIPENILVDNNDPLIQNEIINILNTKTPFAFKDPRFSYTLPVWIRNMDEQARLICMFRNPVLTVKSALFECATAEYLKEFHIDEALCYQLWANCYQYIIKNYLPVFKERLIFVSYDQLVDNGETAILSSFLNAQISNAFIDPVLNRSKGILACPAYISDIHNTLLLLSKK